MTNVATKEFLADIEGFARIMAEEINGGSWDVDYTESQKKGWMLRAAWACGFMSEETVHLNVRDAGKSVFTTMREHYRAGI